MTRTADQTIEAAYQEFDEWVKVHDPYGKMTLLEQIDAYAEWHRPYGEKAKDQ